MIQYFIEVSLAWFVLYMLYFFFLRKETFFNSNRWYLLNCLWIGLLIPFLRNIPNYFNKAQVLLSEPLGIINSSTHSVSSFVTSTTQESTFLNFESILITIYTIGVIVSCARMIFGLHRIMQKIKNGRKLQMKDYTLVISNSTHLPFSFFKFIFIDESFFNNKSFEKILNHEITHVSGGHTFDVLILEILSIIFWWNPMIDLYKIAIKQTHEFIADFSVSQYIDKKKYGHILLGHHSSGIELALSNQFFNSHLKKRINMLFKEKSANSKRSRYLLVIPFVCFLALLFSSNTLNNELDNIPEDLESILDELLVDDFFQNLTAIPENLDLENPCNNIQSSYFFNKTYQRLINEKKYESHIDYIKSRFIAAAKEQDIALQISDDGKCFNTKPIDIFFEISIGNTTDNILYAGVPNYITIKNHGRLEKLVKAIVVDNSSFNKPRFKSFKDNITVFEITPTSKDEGKEVEILFALENESVTRKFLIQAQKLPSKLPSDLSDNDKKESEITKFSRKNKVKEISNKGGMRLTTPSDYKGKFKLNHAYVFTLLNEDKKPNWTPNIYINNETLAKLEMITNEVSNESIDFVIMPKMVTASNEKLILSCTDGDLKIQEIFIIEDSPKVNFEKPVAGTSLLPEHMSNPLWIINGELSDSKNAHYFTKSKIVDIKIIEGKEAVDKYGIRAKQGAAEIMLKE